MATVAPSSGGTSAKPTAVTLIDCDVHHAVKSHTDLYPYLPRQFVEYIQDFGTMLPGVGYTNPG